MDPQSLTAFRDELSKIGAEKTAIFRLSQTMGKGLEAFQKLTRGGSYVGGAGTGAKALEAVRGVTSTAPSMAGKAAVTGRVAKKVAPQGYVVPPAQLQNWPSMQGQMLQ